MEDCVNHGHFRPGEVIIADHEVALLFRDDYCEKHWNKEQQHAEENSNNLFLKVMLYARRWAKLMQMLLDEGATFEEAAFIINNSADLDDIRRLKRISYSLLINYWKYGDELEAYLSHQSEHTEQSS